MGARGRPKKWRRGRDSNPGPGSTPGNRLAGGCLRPTRPPLRPSIFAAAPSFVNQPAATPAARHGPRELAEGEGFEPPRARALPVFKTGAFDRSATPPLL